MIQYIILLVENNTMMLVAAMVVVGQQWYWHWGNTWRVPLKIPYLCDHKCSGPVDTILSTGYQIWIQRINKDQGVTRV
jgi:hypothetical protein